MFFKNLKQRLKLIQTSSILFNGEDCEEVGIEIKEQLEKIVIN